MHTTRLAELLREAGMERHLDTVRPDGAFSRQVLLSLLASSSVDVDRAMATDRA